MNLFVFGLGYSIEAYLRARGADWGSVVGTVRTREKADRLAARYPGLEVFQFDGERADPEIAECLRSADALIVSIPPRDGDPALARYENVVAQSRLSRIVYLSTLGVYGGQNGEWVDESTPPAARFARGDARIAAEDQWLALGDGASRRVFVLRLAGIYGPGRNAIVNLRSGAARRIVKPGQVFNRIHVADIAQAIDACLRGDNTGGIFNVCDDEPSPPQDVIEYAARLIGASPPPEIPFDQAEMSPMARSFWLSSQRVSNRKLRRELGVDLLYPTYREGVAALARQDA